MQKKVLRVSFLSAIAALALIAVGCTPNGQPVTGNQNSTNTNSNSNQATVNDNGSDENTENVNDRVKENNVNANVEAESEDKNRNTNQATSEQATEKTFTVIGSNFSYDVKEIKVKKGDKVKIIFKNVEGFHDWNLDEFNAHTAKIQGGSQAELEFVVDKTGTFEYYCSVGSHRQMGMVGNLIVE
ncbi:MAG: cupredoxin domain-containing protein [Patescibacteria group bacterium]|nr:cupredoxin domain-containing protein [Patescibacteria group bacterium]